MNVNYEIGEFEPDYYLKFIVNVWVWFMNSSFMGSGPFSAYDIGMFYYKKNGLECWE